MTKKQISAEKFAALSLQKQLNVLRRDGVFVGKLKDENTSTIFLQLYHFYIEIIYEEYRTKIKKLVVSENIETLLPYLDQIEINGLDDLFENEKNQPER